MLGRVSNKNRSLGFVIRRSLSKNAEWLKAAQKELRGREVSEVRFLENIENDDDFLRANANTVEFRNTGGNQD